MKTTVPTVLDDSDLDKLKNLKKGDKLYSLQFEHSGNGENSISVTEYVFNEYIDPKQKGKNFIEGTQNLSPGEGQLLADLTNIKFLNTKLAPIDIGVGFFFSVDEAVKAFYETLEDIRATVEGYAIKHNIQLVNLDTTL
jgi:hypothetical protein